MNMFGFKKPDVVINWFTSDYESRTREKRYASIV